MYGLMIPRRVNTDRHVVRVLHTWNSKTSKPEGYILGYSLKSSGSGKHQTAADYHVLCKQFEITNVAAMVGDNVKTRGG